MSGPSISHLLMRPKDVHCVWVPRGDGKTRSGPEKSKCHGSSSHFFLFGFGKEVPLYLIVRCWKKKLWSDWWLQLFLMFTRTLGKIPHFDEHIFQRGWFNHQLVVFANLIYIHIWHVHWSVPPGSLPFSPPETSPRPNRIRNSSNHSFSLAMFNLGGIRIFFSNQTSSLESWNLERIQHPLQRAYWERRWFVFLWLFNLILYPNIQPSPEIASLMIRPYLIKGVWTIGLP